jgi:hypothetical protein
VLPQHVDRILVVINLLPPKNLRLWEARNELLRPSARDELRRDGFFGDAQQRQR